jgi:hypothetical protein
MIRRTTLLFVVVALISGCGDSSTLEVRPRGSLTDPTDLAGLVLRINGESLTADDFGPDEVGLVEAKVEVPNSGDLIIEVELTQAQQLVGSGVVQWELQENFEWGLDVFRQVDDPMGSCIGCFGSHRVVIAPSAQRAPGEALWFAWGGKPRDSDIVY